MKSDIYFEKILVMVNNKLMEIACYFNTYASRSIDFIILKWGNDSDYAKKLTYLMGYFENPEYCDALLKQWKTDCNKEEENQYKYSTQININNQ